MKEEGKKAEKWDEWEEFGAESELSEPERIYRVGCPVEGAVIPLTVIPDVTFAYGMLGPGVGIRPEKEIVLAPFDGEVSALFETRHAVGLTSDEGGVEVLIHVGINTVELNGAFLTALVKAGEKVKAGQPLLKFDRAKIEAAGYNTTVAVLVSNVYLFPRIRVLGYGKKKEMERMGQESTKSERKTDYGKGKEDGGGNYIHGCGFCPVVYGCGKKGGVMRLCKRKGLYGD